MLVIFDLNVLGKVYSLLLYAINNICDQLDTDNQDKRG